MDYYDKTVLNAEDPKEALLEWWDEMQYRRIYAHENKLIRPLSLLIEMQHMIEMAYRVFGIDGNPIDFWLEQLTPEERKKYKL